MPRIINALVPPKGSRKADNGPPPLKFTTFSVIGFLNGKNVAANFVKNDAQSWWSPGRRTSDDEWDKERETKRRKMMGSEEVLQEEEAKRVEAGSEAAGDKLLVNVLTAAPPGLVRPPVVKEPVAQDGEVTIDPLSKTIIIHPGSRWLRIGRASDPFPTTVPHIIARRAKNFVPSASKGKQREEPAAPTMAFPFLPSLPRDTRDADGDEDMEEGAEDDEDEPAVDPAVPVDPVSAKISSIRGDLRARMRAFKLRGQGNGNSQAAAYNATVTPEPTADYNDPNEVEWTDVTGAAAQEVYVGMEALKIPDAEASGYVLRRPYDRGMFNTAGYTSSQELLGDLKQIWLTTLEEELGITEMELKDYSAILIIPDLYDHIYVREMTDLVLKWIGFKQICIQQESICATFGAGISNACVIDIGAKKTSITCIEEGLVLTETRMLLDFGGDDITEFLHTLLIRTNFPYRDADLSRWADYTLMEELKERMVVLSEADVGLNLYDFYVRAPGKPTRKYTLRSYDDVILAPYALFAPRVVEFEKKIIPQVELWSKDVEDIIDIGGNVTTNAMRNSVRHLLPPPLPVQPALPAETEGTPSLAAANSLLAATTSPAPHASAEPATVPGTKAPTRQSTPVKEGPALDVRLESSKLPLDVAVVESIIAAGTEDRMKKVCQNVLIVGGTGLIHNIGFAIESRVSPALAARVPALSGQMAIVPPPREIDPRILAWKGISVLSKLDAAHDLWIRREDWEALGLRAVKERAFYWA